MEIDSENYFDYQTIRVTRSRLDKGLLAIPVALLDLFPKDKRKIKVYFDNSDLFKELNFTPYKSSSREARILGLKRWFQKHNMERDEEIVIQILDDKEYIYRLIPEKIYQQIIDDSEGKLLSADNNNDFEANLSKLSKFTNIERKKLIEREFIKLALNPEISQREWERASQIKRKKNVPLAIRNILKGIYKGKCQLTGFTFLKKDGEPYFEIHHIEEHKGNYLKNLLVVSPNIHAQFTYATKKEFFDNEGWLRKVIFNEINEYNVFQYIDRVKKLRFKKTIFE